MKSKRFLTVLFAFVMLIAALVFTGCSDDTNNDKGEPSGVVTLNMYVITEDETTEEAKLEVQKAINGITVPRYKLLVKINYLTADEYWDVVDKVDAEVSEMKLQKELSKDPEELLKADYIASLKVTEAVDENAASEDVPAEAEVDAAAETTEKAEEAAEEEYVDVAEMTLIEAIDWVQTDGEKGGMKDIVLEEPQIDVLVVDSYDKFVELIEADRLAEIDVKYDRKLITKRVHSTILTTTTVDGDVMGVPANFAMDGQYEFLVYNKNLLDKYGYTVSDLKKVEDMGEYLALIKANEPGYYPISEIPELTGTEIHDDLLFAESSLDTLAATSYPLYLNSAYMTYLQAVEDYRVNGYVASLDGAENVPCAIYVVKSNKLLENKEWNTADAIYEQTGWMGEDGVTYQALLYDIPRVDPETAFSAALCVSANSYHIEDGKAAALIEYLITDAEVANLFRYGISGTHYEMKGEDTVALLDTASETNVYKMNPIYTGNPYIQYELVGEEGSVQAAIDTNLSIAPSAFFGYEPDFGDNAASQAEYDCVKIFSEAAMQKIENGEMTVTEVFNIASKQLNALGCKWNASGSALEGLFGNLASEQTRASEKNKSSFKLAAEAKEYNDVYLTSEELDALAKAEAEKKAQEEAEQLAKEQAALQAQIDAQNKADAEPEEFDPNEADVLTDDLVADNAAEAAAPETEE